jgi:hypothetical protein
MSQEPTAPAEPGDPAGRTDLRQARRFDCPGQPTLGVVVVPGAAPVTVAVRDVATKGIGLIFPEPVGRGTRLTVVWQFGPVSRWRTLNATVARLAPRAGGGWTVGCVLEEPLDAGDVMGFLLAANEARTGHPG